VWRLLLVVPLLLSLDCNTAGVVVFDKTFYGGGGGYDKQVCMLTCRAWTGDDDEDEDVGGGDTVDSREEEVRKHMAARGDDDAHYPRGVAAAAARSDWMLAAHCHEELTFGCYRQWHAHHCHAVVAFAVDYAAAVGER